MISTWILLPVFLFFQALSRLEHEYCSARFTAEKFFCDP